MTSDAAPMGHNGGPALEDSKRQRKFTIRTRWAKALFAHEKTPPYVIAMCWVIHWYSQDDGSGAALSNEQFEAMCGVPDRTVSRGKKWLLENGFVTIRVGRSGQKTRFQMTIPDPQDQPSNAATVAASDAPNGATLASSGRHPGVLEDEQAATLASSPQSIRHPGEVNPPPWRPVGRHPGDLILESTQDKTQERIDAAANVPVESIDPDIPVQSTRPKRGYWQDKLNPQTHASVVMSDDGRLTLLNGARAEWLAMFQGDGEMLDLALKEIAAEIQPNGNVPLSSQVERKLAIMVRRRKEQDSRYEKGVERNNKKTSSQTSQASNATEIALRAMREHRAKRNPNGVGK